MSEFDIATLVAAGPGSVLVERGRIDGGVETTLINADGVQDFFVPADAVQIIDGLLEITKGRAK